MEALADRNLCEDTITCQKTGGLECASKHCGLSIVFLQESLTRPLDDSRDRCYSAYSHLGHVSDVHLPDTYPKIAARARQVRKLLEPCIYRRAGKEACPPKGCIEEVQSLNGEILDQLEQLEHHKHEREEELFEEPIVAKQNLFTSTPSSVSDYALVGILVTVAALVGAAVLKGTR